jgi:hypothetical protein
MRKFTFNPLTICLAGAILALSSSCFAKAPTDMDGSTEELLASEDGSKIFLGMVRCTALLLKVAAFEIDHPNSNGEGASVTLSMAKKYQ